MNHKLTIKLKQLGAKQAAKAVQIKTAKPEAFDLSDEEDAVFVEAGQLPDNLPPLASEIVDTVLWALGDEKKGWIRPSMIGGCKRASFFNLTGAPKQPQKHHPKMQRTLATGTVYHEILQKFLGESLDIYFCPESPVWEKDLDVQGHCDGICITRDLKYKWPIEIKTISKSGFEKLRKPDPKHVWQAHTYAGLNFRGWEGPKFIDIIYICKDNQEWKPYRVPYSEEVFQEIVEWCQLIQDYALRGSPPRFEKAECDTSFCAYVDHCFKLQAQAPKLKLNSFASKIKL